MKKLNLIVAKTCIIYITLSAVKADIARFDTACGLFYSAIYCFGGQTGNVSENTPDSLIYKLDLTKSGDMLSYTNKWELVPQNTNGVILDPRIHTQHAVISDHQLLVSAGFDFQSLSDIVDQTIVFDVNTSSWSRYNSYEEGIYGNRQIYYGASTFVPGKGVAFYGGFEEGINTTWTVDTNQNLDAAIFNNNKSRAIGYTLLTYLDITNPVNIWNIPSPQINAPTVFSAVQSSLFYPQDNRIYYFGGSYEDTTDPDYSPAAYLFLHSFTYSLYFDTTTNTWGNQTLSGSVIPTPRKLHTTTLLPNHPSSVLLYGGEIKGSTLSTDFCYTLDMVSFTWTRHAISSNDGTSLLRSRHSVVVPTNDTVFIVFGVGGSLVATSTPVALNTSDLSSISYMSSFVGLPSLPTTVTDNDTNNSTRSSSPEPSESKGPSNSPGIGVVVGIAVGAAIVVVSIVGILVFCYLYKKRQRKRASLEVELNKMDTDQTSHDPIEINWEDIEKKYRDITVDSDKLPREQSADGSGTVFSGSSDGTTSSVSKPHGDKNPISKPYGHVVIRPDGVI